MLISSSIQYYQVVPLSLIPKAVNLLAPLILLQLPVVDSGLPLVCVVPENRGVMIGDETMGL